MIHLEFDTQREREVHSHKNYELIYVMNGGCTVILDDTVQLLKARDFVIVNSWQRHGYTLGGKSLIGRFHIPYGYIGNDRDDRNIVFLPNQESQPSVEVEKIRDILAKMFSISCQGDTGKELEIQRMFFSLMEVFFLSFAFVETEKSTPSSDAEADERICEIMEYVNHNYNKNVSLNDLASRLFLSSSYLSKYIKQQLGVNFVELLNKTRLSHASDRLVHTDESIAQIALDVGFSNMASFNRTFKDKYKTTPSAYRKDFRYKALTDEVQEDNRPYETAVDSLKTAESIPGDAVQYEEVLVESTASVGILSGSKPWSKTINIGAAEELLHSDVQAHVLELKKSLHFRYVRFWDIFSPGMYLDEHQPGQIYNFSRLDRVLDFLVENHLVPHIEVSNKPKKLMRAMSDDMLSPKKGDSPFKSAEMIRYFFSALMRHLIRRYGAELLDKWVFEYWMEEDEDRTYEYWHYYTQEMIEHYLKNFTVLAETIRRFGTNLKIGGGGFSLRYGRQGFEQLIHLWAAAEQKPSFVSMYIYPYELGDEEACLKTRVLRPDYMKACLMFAAGVMAKEKLKVRLAVTEWNFTVFNRNLMNDSLYKGAWMVKNLFECMDMADVLAYWTGSDLYAECNDQAGFISGNVGLLTKDGIKKPVWYALEFMNSLERFICKRTENAMITQGKYKNFKIVCHNFKPLNYRYFMKAEDEISLGDVDSFFDDRRSLRIYFELPVLPGDSYRIKFLRINQSSGSILDEWLLMSGPEYMDSEDIDYLKKRCVPRITVRTYKEKDGKIAFTTMLEPNEIQLILADCR